MVVLIVTSLIVGCSSKSKPSKEALVDHFVELIKDEGSLGGLVPESTLEKLFQCLVDGIYEDTSAETLNKMLDLETIDTDAEYPVALNENEERVFKAAQEKCDEKYRDEFNSSLENQIQE